MVQRIRRAHAPMTQQVVDLPLSGPFAGMIGKYPHGLTVAVARTGFKGLNSAYMVRGMARRAIRVVVRPFLAAGLVGLDEEKLAILAAARARRNGWKTIVVEPDPIYGDSATTMNWFEFRRQWETGYCGEHLVDAESIAEDWQ